MKTLLLTLAIALAAPVFASADLAKAKGCMACHAVDKKLVGPSFKDVSKKYAGNPNALGLLSTKVRLGGAGVWGPIPMPPHAHVSEKDIKSMIQWILTQ